MDDQAQVKTCYFLLSLKSSGSSIVQANLAKSINARVLEKTTHFENETLYFVKAGSVLGLPQFRMENSRIPHSRPVALRLLREMMVENIPGWNGDLESEQGLFDAWTQLVLADDGHFVEKSPHHLYQPAVVDMLERYADSEKRLTARFIGLVRNPVDTLYSSWTRFGVRPENEEKNWVRGYTKLREFAERRPDLVVTVRYEDLVSGTTRLTEVLGITPLEGIEEPVKFNTRSIQKWRKDSRFGFTPSEETIDLALQYGYQRDELENPNAHAWSLRREPRALAYSLFYLLPKDERVALKSAVKKAVGKKG